MAMKFKKEGDGRKLTVVDGESDKLSVVSTLDAPEGHYFLTLWINDGECVGLDRKEAVDFALAILKESYRR